MWLMNLAKELAKMARGSRLVNVVERKQIRLVCEFHLERGTARSVARLEARIIYYIIT
jgi:hypothetical protein